jgi:hypothetical protein
MKKTPMIVKSSVSYAVERSNEQIKYRKDLVNSGYFVGKNCVVSLILFGQYFIQGKTYELAESFSQLDLSIEETERIIKKKKQKRITDLSTLMRKQEEREYLLGLLEENRATYIRECIEYFPLVDLECGFKVEDEKAIPAWESF